MKLLQFIFLLIRRGSLNQKPVDFESERRALVDSLQVGDIIPKDTQRQRPRRLWKIPGAYSIMASLSYFRDRYHMNKMYYVAPSHKVIYIRILKAGSTSILGDFTKLINSKLAGKSLSDEHIDALGYYLRTTNLPAGYKKFAIVRDPYQRVVSVYLDLFDKSSPVFSYASYWFGILDRNMNFKDFIKVISKIPKSLLGPHFSPQHWILRGISDVKVFRIEEDKKELTDFLSGYGVELQHRNKSMTEYDYRTYYDKETFALVRKIYAGDVERLGYEKEEAVLKEHVFSDQSS
jgi:hypothetical protein